MIISSMKTLNQWYIFFSTTTIIRFTNNIFTISVIPFVLLNSCSRIHSVSYHSLSPKVLGTFWNAFSSIVDISVNMDRTTRPGNLYYLWVKKHFVFEISFFFNFFKIINFVSRISQRYSNEIKYFFYQSIAFGVPYK